LLALNRSLVEEFKKQKKEIIQLLHKIKNIEDKILKYNNSFSFINNHWNNLDNLLNVILLSETQNSDQLPSFFSTHNFDSLPHMPVRTFDHLFVNYLFLDTPSIYENGVKKEIKEEETENEEKENENANELSKVLTLRINKTTEILGAILSFLADQKIETSRLDRTLKGVSRFGIIDDITANNKMMKSKMELLENLGERVKSVNESLEKNMERFQKGWLMKMKKINLMKDRLGETKDQFERIESRFIRICSQISKDQKHSHLLMNINNQNVKKEEEEENEDEGEDEKEVKEEEKIKKKKIKMKI